MKKRFFAGALVVAALMAGCSLINSPKAAVRKFGKVVEKNDMKALEKVATRETVELVASFSPKIQRYMTSMSRKKVKTITQEVDVNTAVVIVTFDDGEEEHFDLIKDGKEWKVDISMDFDF